MCRPRKILGFSGAFKTSLTSLSLSSKESVTPQQRRSYSLDERFLYSQGEVRKVQWHPSSLSHLLVLVSDNTISPLQPKLHGPLSMYPPADDNYGTDSCSILALGGTDSPPLVVVATCSAQLYHCLLLPNCTNNTYACVHAGGVHAMTLPILRQLKDYSLADEAETETMLSAICSNPSVARHLVCTSTTAQLSPPAGVCITTPPLPRLIVVCDDATALTR
ncbi:nuclear pore component domain-containing protein [Phthorimaea operculella]|nr:nuclear pore component domain-containing protein [Phthorimaea operculella]